LGNYPLSYILVPNSHQDTNVTIFANLGRKQQYTYACLYDDMIDKFIGVVKYDLSLEPHLHTRDLRVGGNIKGVFLHGKGRWGSEAIFVPRIASKEILEDDGYLICFVHDERIGYGYFNFYIFHFFSLLAIHF
jgi:carotenoid cleavage dioxygenase-like enzyme